MKNSKQILIILSLVLSMLVAISAMFCTGFWIYLHFTDGYFARSVPAAEQQLRLEVVSTARQWLGTQEGFAGHEHIVQTYNSHEPLAQGYEVKVTDNWCAAFGSFVAIECGLTDIIPTECGCERQIGLWQNIGRWEENDNYLPLPGDYIYYAWDEGWDLGDCTGWADHVGIVVGTAGLFIKVIEGNKNDMVTYRIIMRGNYQIRGYGLPDFTTKSLQKTAG